MNNRTKNVILTPFNILYRISPELDLKILFRLKQGYPLNLKNPGTYNEKIQWIKLYDKNPLMPKCCDKYAVREFVQKQGCGKILNDLLWQGFHPEEIPFDSLPERFVIKATHGSTFNIICTDKNKLNREKVIKTCRNWMKEKFLPCYGEWFYGIEKPRVIVEKYIESDDGGQLKDYKIYCFHGEPEYIRVVSDRFTNQRDNVFTKEWKELKGVYMGHGYSGCQIQKPGCLEEMLSYARKLSRPFQHARVDFYVVRNTVVFGEITFTNGAGFDSFSSYEFDLMMGNCLTLQGGG